MGYARGIRWSDELIREKVLEVSNFLSLNRMPSRQECENYFGDTALTNAVSRRMGWYSLAKDLGLPIKTSNTTFGKSFESMAEQLLLSKGFQVIRMSQNFPYDLLIDNCVKVDVKASRMYHGSQGYFYSFSIEKKFASCDFYLLLAVNDDREIQRCMVVPSCYVVFNKQISVGVTNSKYHRFTDRWDLIENASCYWRNLCDTI